MLLTTVGSRNCSHVRDLAGAEGISCHTRIKGVFISWIKVSRLTYPLYSYSPQRNEVYFDIGEKFIYHWGLELNDSTPDPFPVAIDPSVTFRVKLAGSFHERSTYRLCANLRNAYTNETDMPLHVFEESFNGTAGNV
jgi:hypothetical protein